MTATQHRTSAAEIAVRWLTWAGTRRSNWPAIRLTYTAPAYRANFPMTSLRLLADDLTGALDSAAEFIALTGPVHAFWRGAIPAQLPANAALDSCTRELQAAQAAAIVIDLTHHLSGGSISFKK